MIQILVLASLILGMTMPCVAWSETIAELVSREDGVDFGRCELTPRPHLRGAVVHAVIPAWFEKPGIWATRSLLLVGVDDSGTVQQQRKLDWAPVYTARGRYYQLLRKSPRCPA